MKRGEDLDSYIVAGAALPVSALVSAQPLRRLRALRVLSCGRAASDKEKHLTFSGL